MLGLQALLINKNTQLNNVQLNLFNVKHDSFRVAKKAANPEGVRLFIFTGGSCEIRTHGGRKTSAVFKTAAFNRSAKLPFGCK